jgi:multidrug transporter EmrE-like cation transporter
MNPPATTLPEPTHVPFTKMQSVGLVFICTILGAAAQVLMKIGGTRLQHFEVLRVITDVPLIAGYALYGINTVLLMLALRDGELSLLYPVIALTYVWVTILSVFFFLEEVNLMKIGGIALIMVGVIVLGRAGTR